MEGGRGCREEGEWGREGEGKRGRGGERKQNTKPKQKQEAIEAQLHKLFGFADSCAPPPLSKTPIRNEPSRDVIFPRRGRAPAAFPTLSPGSEAMGSQEVLGQAARLASSGLLLQVLCCARSKASCDGQASRGGCSGSPALHRDHGGGEGRRV